MMSSALVEWTAPLLPFMSSSRRPMLSLADDFLLLLFKLHSGSPWLLFGGVEGTQTVTTLIAVLTLALAIPLGGRNGDQAGINYCLHLAFPHLPIVYRGRSILPCLPFLSLPPEPPAGDVSPSDSSHTQCLALKL